MGEYDWAAAKAKLGHVLWFGGGSRGGKSTLSERLSEEFGFTYYNGDAHALGHMKTAKKDLYPNLWLAGQKWAKGEFFEYLGAMSAEEMAEVFRSWGDEDLELAVEDLLSLPNDKPIAADGCATNPGGLLRIAERRNIVLLISTDAFQRQMIESSAKERGEEPEENYIDGQRLFSEYQRAEAKRMNTTVIVTGGRLSLDESYEAVCSYFGLDGEHGHPE